MNNVYRSILMPMFILGLAACATPERIVLLPQADGSSSAVVVRSKAGEIVLDQPYAVAAVTERRIELEKTDAATVNKRYRSLADALPPRPRSYLLYFETGGNQLTPESATQLDDVARDLNAMPAAELLVIGHTDSVGSDQVNDEISAARADLVRTVLLDRAGNRLRIETVGRGKRDLLFPTGDGVAEPRNRVVEIRLR